MGLAAEINVLFQYPTVQSEKLATNDQAHSGDVQKLQRLVKVWNLGQVKPGVCKFKSLYNAMWSTTCAQGHAYDYYSSDIGVDQEVETPTHHLMATWWLNNRVLSIDGVHWAPALPGPANPWAYAMANGEAGQLASQDQAELEAAR